MIHILSDFGWQGPYLGEVEAVLARLAPEICRIRLMADLPAFSPRRSAYLLAALARRFEPGDLCLAIVDPGVGGERAPLALDLDGRWFVGPDNGLFELVIRRAWRVEGFRIAWRPEALSATFHGRDLFAPMAARLARGERGGLEPHRPRRFADWPDDWPCILYTDRYGNAITGLRAEGIAEGARLRVAGRELPRARTFSDVAPRQPFFHANSMGLVEIAVRDGNAVETLALTPGTTVELLLPGS